MNHWIMAGVILAVTTAVFLLGWHSHGLWADRQSFRSERHTHRKGDPQETTLLQPRELSPFPGSGVAGVGYVQGQGWVFAGGWDQGPVTEPAERDLLTQTAVQPVSVTGEPPIDTGEIDAITDETDAWIAKMKGDTNEFIFGMRG